MNSFIARLLQEGRIRLLQPNLDQSRGYLEKSYTSLLSAKALHRIRHFDDATTLTYYSMYNAALAILFKCGIKSENHVGTVMLLRELFGIRVKSIEDARKERIEKQYYIDRGATELECMEGLRAAESFNELVRIRAERLTEEDIRMAREALQNGTSVRKA